MGFWAEIKMALNSTLGNNLKPLDVIVKNAIKDAEHEICYSELEKEALSGNTNVYVFPRGEQTISAGFSTGDNTLVGKKIIAVPMYAAVVSNIISKDVVTIKLPNTVESFHSGAFKGNSNLSSIEIPNRINTIPSNCFKDCTSLSMAVIPESVKKISAGAFENCSSLKNIIYDGKQKDWANVEIDSTAFLGRSQTIWVCCSDGDYRIS
jgi:hypothetical protein